MAHLGNFEAAVKAADPNVEPDTFGMCGSTFTVAQDLNIVALGRFARAARDGGDTDDMEGLAALIDTVASLVIPEDENRFLDVASRNRVDADFLLNIVQAVMEAQAGRPTGRPSGSPDGSSTTGTSSRVPSSYEVSSHQAAQNASAAKWMDSPFGRRELAANPELYRDFVGVAEVDASQLV